VNGAQINTQFAGSIPELYEKYLVPLRFGTSAVDGKIQAHVITVVEG
jgi:hypothetical protein